jgi:hypothetical protein
MRLGLRFRRAVRLGRPVAAFRHELVEFGFVLGVPQPVKEIAELALLLLEPAQQLIRPLPMMNASVARPSGHQNQNPRIMRAIQAGLPNSSSFATMGMTASRL